MEKSKRKNSDVTSAKLTETLVDELVDISFNPCVKDAIELAVRSVLSDGTFPKHHRWEILKLLPDQSGEDWLEKTKARNTKKTFKISLPYELLEELDTACRMKYPYLRTMSEQIEYCIITMIVEHQTAKLGRPIRLPGSKWGEMKNVSQTVLDGRKYKKVVEPCVGALGIFCNIDCADEIFLNDYDTGKYCFYRELQTKPVRLLNKLLSEQPSIEKCKCYKKILREIDPSYIKKKPSERDYSNADIADMFFYENYYSKDRRAKGEVPLYVKPTLEYICSILKDAERLRGIMVENPETINCPRQVRLTNKDLLELIPMKNDKDTLIICDPPYPYTGAYQENLTIDQHRQLAYLLKKHKGDFIYFCRLTERKDNEIFASTRVHAFITDMFASDEKNVTSFFLDIDTRDGMERVITNFNFDGATPYTFETDAIKRKADVKKEKESEEKKEAEKKKAGAQKEEDAEENSSSDEKGGDSDEK
ncbi:MAG: DNA adenine methylase [Lachnospiraceae bacterium]|nr:DNA adenine methylase [Lachnospiraceae bacterium]